jgi:hypothetical protein
MARSPENVLMIMGAVLLDLSALGLAVIRSLCLIPRAGE